jgi:hypothetical protein
LNEEGIIGDSFADDVGCVVTHVTLLYCPNLAVCIITLFGGDDEESAWQSKSHSPSDPLPEVQAPPVISGSFGASVNFKKRHLDAYRLYLRYLIPSTWIQNVVGQE